MRRRFTTIRRRSEIRLHSWKGRSRRLTIEALHPRVLLATLPPGFIEEPAADNLVRATAMEFAPNGDLWVLEQGGLVKRFQTGSTAADVVGDINNLAFSS